MSAQQTRPTVRLRLYALVALLAISRVPDPACAGAPPALPSRPFKATDWDLAWQAFVGSGDINDAYALSRSAITARPDSLLWLGRLAESARWSNHPQTALAALSRLALHLHQRDDLQPALDLALGLGRDGRAVVLLRELIHLGRATAAQRRMLSGLYLDIGEPQRAIAELQRQFERHPAPELLWEQVVIERMLGDPARERSMLQRYRKHFGTGSKVMLALATLDYLQSRLPQALNALLAAEPRARPEDTAYWQTLSGLAWQLGRYRLAARAARVLIDTDHADVSAYLRVIYAEQYRHPGRAFALAAHGWQQTHEPTLFLSLLGIAAARHPSTPWLARAFALLGAGQAAAFVHTPFYSTSLAALRAGQGRTQAALAAYQRALDERPGDNRLLAGYLWLLIDTHELASIAPRLHRLDRRARTAPQLWAPLAAAYAALHRPEQALPWLQAQWRVRRHDPQWLLDDADTLQQAGRAEAAWAVRRRAYAELAHRGAPRTAPGRERRQLALARLAGTLTPGDPARRAIVGLARQSRDPEPRLTVLAALQNERAYSLARWWGLRVLRGSAPPPWARLAQALSAHDRAALGALLERHRAQLAPRDREAAARALGWDSQALTLTYRELQYHPTDRRLQRRFETLALAQADSVGAEAQALQISGLLEEGWDVRARHELPAHERLEIRLQSTHQRSVDHTQFGTPPALSRAALLVWHRSGRSTGLSLELGAGRNLAGWLRGGITWQQNWSGSVHTRLAAIAGARPLDTAALSVGALEDRVSALVTQQWTPRAALALQVQAGQLRAQGGGALGSVQRFSLTGEYRLGFAPPDFTLQASLSGAHYARAARLPAQLRPLVPTDLRPSVSFFVPRSFVQVCAGGHFNVRDRRAFVSRLRPYANADLCANSVSGQGYDLTAGLATPVFGADHLSLSMTLQSNVGTHSGRTSGVMLRYRHYFSPTP